MEELLISWIYRTWLIMGLVTALVYLYYQVHYNGSCVKDELILDTKFYFMLIIGGYFAAMFFLPMILLGVELPNAQDGREMNILNAHVKSIGLPHQKVVDHLIGHSGEYRQQHWDRVIAQPARKPVQDIDHALAKTADALESGAEAVKVKSKFALACGAIIAFLLTPINFVRSQVKGEIRPQVHGAVIMDIEPEMNVGFAKVRITGHNVNSSYLVEADWATARLSRAFINWKLSPYARLKIGQDFTPCVFTISPPPIRPVCNSLVSTKEFPIVSPGIFLNIDNDELINAEIQLTENCKGDKRLISRLTRTVSQNSDISLVADFTGRETKWLTSLIFNKRIMRGRIGYLKSKTGITRYLQLVFQPRKEVALVVRYENSPWIKNKDRWTAGINFLWEKARLRLSWISDLTPLAQLSYTF